MLNIFIDFIVNGIKKIDGVYILGFTLIMYTVLFVINISIFQKNALRYTLFCIPNTIIYVFFMMFRNDYDIKTQVVCTFILLIAFSIFILFNFNYKKRIKKEKENKKFICESVAVPTESLPERQGRFNYIRTNERCENVLPSVDTAHAHELINNIREKQLNYIDKNQIDEIAYVVNKVDNGINRQVLIEFNEAMCQLLKLVAKYNV